MTWLTPDELDAERWRYRGMKPFKGGWTQPLWIALQDAWYITLEKKP